jgi:hypothetical protein
MGVITDDDARRPPRLSPCGRGRAAAVRRRPGEGGGPGPRPASIWRGPPRRPGLAVGRPTDRLRRAREESPPRRIARNPSPLPLSLRERDSRSPPPTPPLPLRERPSRRRQAAPGEGECVGRLTGPAAGEGAGPAAQALTSRFCRSPSGRVRAQSRSTPTSVGDYSGYSLTWHKPRIH